MTEQHLSTVASRRRAPIILAALLLVMTIVLGLLATFDTGQPVERSVIKAIAFREGKTVDGLIGLMQWITWVGDASQRTLAMVAFAAWLIWRKRGYAALTMLVVPPLAGAASSILKEAFGRARPDIVPHLDVISNLSYPSGHATNVMATYLLAALLIPQSRRSLWVLLAISVAIAIGLSRILLGVHWPSDVVGGWCWGAGIALIGFSLARKWEPVPQLDQKEKRTPMRKSRPESGA